MTAQTLINRNNRWEKELVDIINLEYDINVFNALLSIPHSLMSLFVKNCLQIYSCMKSTNNAVFKGI